MCAREEQKIIIWGGLEGGPLMWMMPLHLRVNQKSDYDDDINPLMSTSL